MFDHAFIFFSLIKSTPLAFSLFLIEIFLKSSVTKTAPPPGDGPPSYQPIENGKPEDAKEDPKEETPAAEAEPLMNKDGSVE